MTKEFVQIEISLCIYIIENEKTFKVNETTTDEWKKNEEKNNKYQDFM